MTVYVDDMRARFARYVMCHMVADTEAELHAMADRIGVSRRWYQGDHYDICRSKRALAVAAGAVQVTWREAAVMVVARRRSGRLPSVDEVPTLLRAMQDRVRGRLAAADVPVGSA